LLPPIVVRDRLLRQGCTFLGREGAAHGLPTGATQPVRPQIPRRQAQQSREQNRRDTGARTGRPGRRPVRPEGKLKRVGWFGFCFLDSLKSPCRFLTPASDLLGCRPLALP